MKKILLFGAGSNCDIFLKFLDRERIRIVGIVDKSKKGEKGGFQIDTPSHINDYAFDELFLTMRDYEDAKEFALSLGIDEEKIKDPAAINEECLLTGFGDVRYVLLADPVDFMHAPYLCLSKRTDVAVVSLLCQKKKKPFQTCSFSDEYIFLVRDGGLWNRLKEYEIWDVFKKTYPNSRFILLTADMYGGEYGGIVQLGKNCLIDQKNDFDRIITYHKGDSEKYQIDYLEQVYEYEIQDVPDNIEFDVLFVGNAKNRLGILHELYSVMTKKGVRCMFYISGVEKELQIRNSSIVYNNRISYGEYINLVKKCRCILDICQTGDETSYRYAEAIYFGKKLITNDERIKERDTFDERYMKTIRTSADLDCDWIYRAEDVKYIYSDLISPDKLIEYLDEENSA